MTIERQPDISEGDEELRAMSAAYEDMRAADAAELGGAIATAESGVVTVVTVGSGQSERSVRKHAGPLYDGTIRIERPDYDAETSSWQDESNCLGVDPDLFFPERGASTREAKEVCRGCSVRQDCLEFALVNGEKFGIWGGLSERERRRIRRQRAQSNRRTAE